MACERQALELRCCCRPAATIPAVQTPGVASPELAYSPYQRSVAGLPLARNPEWVGALLSGVFPQDFLHRV
jgi:hypothetical protein